MPRIDREDGPGTLHHVVSRGLGRRTLFESDADARVFLAQVARVVRAGDLELHAYAVLTTHYHLLVGSPRGRLSAAMQRVQEGFALWFNRTRGRDGPLFRGRFWSRRVVDAGDLLAVARYIDANPVAAGLAAQPADYAHGSARHYLAEVAPPWLSRGLLRGETARLRPGVAGQASYASLVWGEFDRADNAWRVERGGGKRISRPRGGGPLWDAAACVRSGLLGDNSRADGFATPFRTHAPARVLHARAEAVPDAGARRVRAGRTSYSMAEVLDVAALVKWSGLSQREVAERTGGSAGAIRRRLSVHRGALQADPAYQRRWAHLEAFLSPDGAADIPGMSPPSSDPELARNIPGMLSSRWRGVE